MTVFWNWSCMYQDGLCACCYWQCCLSKTSAPQHPPPTATLWHSSLNVCIISECLHHLWMSASSLNVCIISECLHHLWMSASSLNVCIISECLHHLWMSASSLNVCIISAWSAAHHLKLNLSKDELLSIPGQTALTWTCQSLFRTVQDITVHQWRWTWA